MFLPENPIEKYEDDFLGRKKFSEHLSKAITEWKEKESLVIALYGKWGIGKTSLLNMTIDYLQNNSQSKVHFNVVKFNPWALSESDNLLGGFIQELVAVLMKTKQINKKLISKLEYYSSLLSLTPKKDEVKASFNTVLSILALTGITFSQINTLISKIPNVINLVFFWGGLGYFSIVILRQIIGKLLAFLNIQTKYTEKSINETKKDIVSILMKESQKLLVVIDDIDRLSTKEIRQIFRIIRTNADFPNTIYLLAFDRDVIEKNLAVQEGISGHDYLEKIVQVNFTLPCVSESKIHLYLFHELEQLFKVLPKSANDFINNGPHWANVFHSGFKSYFKNIRDVKRYINGLEFNISQLIQEDVIEVNPIDFLAIELLRLFEPQYYDFLVRNKTIFTEISSSYESGSSNRETKKSIILNSFDLVEEKNKNDLKNIIYELFPQVKGFSDGYGNTSYSHNSESEWTQELRICSSRMFDSYFNFIPGGDEKEISIYELSKVSNASKNHEELIALFDHYKAIGKFENLIIRIQDFTSEKDFFQKANFEIVIQALFDTYIDLPPSTPNFLGYDLEIQIVRVIYQIVKRNTNLEDNYQLLSQATKKSKSLYGPIYFLGIEIKKDEKEQSSYPEVIPTERLPEIKKLCATKIVEFKDQLFDDVHLIFILFRWREWCENSEYDEYIHTIMADDEKFLIFFDKFTYETQSYTMGDYIGRTHKRFHYQNLAEFCNLEEVKKRLEMIIQDSVIYTNHKYSIDLFMKYFDKRNSDFMFDSD